jgi:hypothetical protein
MSRDGGGEEERWWWEGGHQMQKSKGWGKGRVCEGPAAVISRGRARAWAAQRSRHASTAQAWIGRRFGSSSVARLWARAGKERRGQRGVRDSAQVMCCACAEPARTQAQCPTHFHFSIPFLFLGLSHADDSCELETLPLSRRCRTHSS